MFSVIRIELVAALYPSKWAGGSYCGVEVAAVAAGVEYASLTLEGVSRREISVELVALFEGFCALDINISAKSSTCILLAAFWLGSIRKIENFSAPFSTLGGNMLRLRCEVVGKLGELLLSPDTDPSAKIVPSLLHAIALFH